MTDQIDYLTKIKKLFAKANDESLTEAEAELFMNKVQELLAEHNLTEADLKEEDKPGINETFFPVSVDVSWFRSLASVVAKMYFCKIYLRHKNVVGRKTQQTYYVFVGRDNNRYIAASMFDYLMKTMDRLALKFNDAKSKYEYKKGCTMRLSYRVHEKTKEATKVNPLNPNNLPALYSTELALVEDYMKESIKMNGRTNKTSVNISNSAAMQGWNDGGSVSLSQQMNGGSKAASVLIGR
jgi:hypothetical protein